MKRNWEIQKQFPQDWEPTNPSAIVAMVHQLISFQLGASNPNSRSSKSSYQRFDLRRVQSDLVGWRHSSLRRAFFSQQMDSLLCFFFRSWRPRPRTITTLACLATRRSIRTRGKRNNTEKERKLMESMEHTQDNIKTSILIVPRVNKKKHKVRGQSHISRRSTIYIIRGRQISSLDRIRNYMKRQGKYLKEKAISWLKETRWRELT